MQRTSTRRHDFAEALLGPLERRWGRITKEYDGTHPMPQGHLPGRGPFVAIPDAATAGARPATNVLPRPPAATTHTHLADIADRRDDTSILHSGLVGT